MRAEGGELVDALVTLSITLPDAQPPLLLPSSCAEWMFSVRASLAEHPATCMYTSYKLEVAAQPGEPPLLLSEFLDCSQERAEGLAALSGLAAARAAAGEPLAIRLVAEPFDVRRVRAHLRRFKDCLLRPPVAAPPLAEPPPPPPPAQVAAPAEARGGSSSSSVGAGGGGVGGGNAAVTDAPQEEETAAAASAASTDLAAAPPPRPAPRAAPHWRRPSALRAPRPRRDAGRTAPHHGGCPARAHLPRGFVPHPAAHSSDG